MKKLFFFRSSAPSNGSTEVSPSKTEKRDYLEHPFEGTGLRRSRSLSAASLLDGGKQKSSSGLKDENGAAYSNLIGTSDQQCERSNRRQASPLRRQCREKQFEMIYNDYGAVTERPCSAVSSRSYCDSSGNSSTSSGNVSSKILDRYIDNGEQQVESSKPQNCITPRNYPGHGSRRRPPRGRSIAPTSPKHVINEKSMSHPSEEFPSSNYHHFPAKYGENGLGHESPRTIAKNLIEILSQSHGIPKTSPKGFDNSVPITVGDILDRCASEEYDSNVDVIPQKFYSVHEPSEAINRNKMENSGLDRQNLIDHSEVLNLVETKEEMDGELRRRIKVAKERVMLFREERDRESFLQQRTGVSGLVQTIRHLSEEKMSLALEVLSLLESQIIERASAKEELRLAKETLDSQTKKLDREKTELQSELEIELDRRSNDWSIKLEKYQLEEQRLRERVRELAEQNVSLQREVSLINERDTENRSLISNSEQKVKDLTIMMDKFRDENQVLMQNLSDLQDKYKTVKEDRESFKRNFEEKEKECKELYKATTRLTRTCCDQQKTIDGLQERFTQELGKNTELEKFDKRVVKLQMEQIRLTGVELGLRRELESCRFEIDSLRHENISIFNRLKNSEKDNGALTIKLDEEMLARVDCLQHQGLTLLYESSQLCAELLEFIKEKVHYLSESIQGMEAVKNNLDGLYFIESEIKVQGLKRGTESLKRSLSIVSSLLHKKTNADGSMHLNCDASEHVLNSELKAERLLTSLVKEKLYSKELEIEQLQAEIATAARANHILRCELQNAQDNISCITHKLKDLELQILKRDKNVNQLQNDLEESTTELAIIRGTVPKISEERDMMWDQVKQYNEENMLLNSEVNLLKKKIESLEEDILLREGQITILKDSMRNRSFDLLGNIESTDEFLVR
ncbi:hypothetical protein SDJN02_07075 [Cucurbita argyrosperma subsp. argyrosperma]|uniref:Interaptin-like n=1 Tax=Cucurbita moschata TaxID=3662 RepID=A0A6J1GME4_CUCMO|nr:interaptin-like [Cucurbita moschata]XP_022952682.1 interaptin-like [Cucurbita moschata]KAG7033022.1 hypothetical protein SDJN02_07075 [Cucurbita argyrosperma subsp. argyrosperma]